jgi:hypothetical protein
METCEEYFVIGFSLDSSVPMTKCKRPKGHTDEHSNISDDSIFSRHKKDEIDE